jgi:UDP-glucose 4-epimerase
MNIAVTGGAGFIGSHLCERAVKNGHYVVCLDNYYTGRKENISHLRGHKNFKSIQCDIMDRSKIEKIFKEESIDLVYHYAAVVGVKRTLEKPKEVLDVNIKGTENVFEAALSSSCKKVVNISSSEVYGVPVELPEREGSPKNVELPYAISKLLGEKYAEIYYEKYGLRTTSLRLFNVYGPRQNSTPYGFVVGIFIDRVLRNKPPVVFGDGTQTRDFTYIEDNIAPTVMAGEKSAANGKVINIATGKPTTILDLSKLVIELCRKRIKPIFDEERPHEIMHRLADITKMKKVLGYKPRYELKDGLRETIGWYKKR